MHFSLWHRRTPFWETTPPCDGASSGLHSIKKLKFCILLNVVISNTGYCCMWKETGWFCSLLWTVCKLHLSLNSLMTFCYTQHQSSLASIKLTACSLWLEWRSDIHHHFLTHTYRRRKKMNAFFTINRWASPVKRPIRMS